MRLYGWTPHAISLGYHQRKEEIDLELCREKGIDIVSRPTGGRAILHADELTYSVIMPESSQYYEKEISKVYEEISQCLVAGLNMLNFPVEFERAVQTPKDFSKGELSSMCYASTVQHEISYQGKKLVGSAQRRLNGVVLQHGSILIGNDHLDIANYLSGKSSEAKEKIKSFMMKKTICLNDLSNGNTVSYSDLAAAIKSGFEEKLYIKFLETELTPREVKTVEKIKTVSIHE